MYKKVITSTHYNRPEYTKQCIEYLENAYNIDSYLILFCVEPDNEQVIDIILDNNLHNKTVIINDKKKGIYQNKLQALQRGFEISNYVIHVEDDILLAKDALLYFEWANKFEVDSSIFNITAYSKTPKNIEKEKYFKARRQNWHTCWGVATWRDRWQFLLKNNWNGSDVFLLQNLFGNRKEVCPLLSRAQNIGVKDGYHSVIFNEEWYRENHLLKYWYENICDGQIGKFEEI